MKKLLALTFLPLACAIPAHAASQPPTLKSMFLQGDYHACRDEGVRRVSAGERGDELYYYTGLSCLKTGDHANAFRAFEALLKHYRESAFADEARVGMGDSFYIRGDMAAAKQKYENFIRQRFTSKLKPSVYYRLYLVGKRKGDLAMAESYRQKLVSEFPQSPEARMDKEIFPSAIAAVDAKTPSASAPKVSGVVDLSQLRNRYSIQVGAFSKRSNADALAARLKDQGYDAFVENVLTRGSILIYKVKVGQFTDYADAKAMEKKLASKGYSTRLDSQ